MNFLGSAHFLQRSFCLKKIHKQIFRSLFGLIHTQREGSFYNFGIELIVQKPIIAFCFVLSTPFRYLFHF